MRASICCGVATAALTLSVATLAHAGKVSSAFTLNSVEVGGDDGLQGMPITPTFGDFFQHLSGNNYPPNPSDFGQFPSLRWDSYIAASGQGASSEDNDGVGAPEASFPQGFDAVSGHFDVNNALRGGWFGEGPFNQSAINPFSQREGVFIARLTMLQGAMPQSDGIFVSIEEDGDMMLPLLIDGEQMDDDDYYDERGGRVFQIGAYRSGQGMNLNPSSVVQGDTMLWDSWDIWVELVPAPTAVAVIGGAGIFGISRRRR